MSEPTGHRPDRTDLAAERAMERFDRALHAWGSRPPATPAGRAARRTVDRLPDRRRVERLSSSVRRTALAATVVAAVGLALLTGVLLGPGGFDGHPPGDPAPEGPVASAPATPPPAPPGDVLVIDLDTRTTLYLNLSGPARR